MIRVLISALLLLVVPHPAAALDGLDAGETATVIAVVRATGGQRMTTRVERRIRGPWPWRACGASCSIDRDHRPRSPRRI